MKLLITLVVALLLPLAGCFEGTARDIGWALSTAGQMASEAGQN